jgi:hypothetical protein
MSLVLHGTVSDNTAVLSRRNAKPLIINGDMAVAQRATSVAGITASTMAIDRMQTTLSGLGTWTLTQDTTVPTAKGFSKSLKMDVTTADASPAAGDFCNIQYKIEAQDLQLLKYGTSSAEAFTLKAHVRSSKTGTHIVHVYQNDGTRHISKAYTIDTADTYQEVIINIPGDTGGTINNDNGIGLQIEFFLGAGSNFTSGTLATSWAGYTGANTAVGQVNCADNTANNFFITGIQMEVGDFDTNSIAPFQHESFGDSLARCQRYYTTSYSYGTAAGTATYDGSVKGESYRADRIDICPQFKVAMRAVPTVTIYSPTTGSAGNVYFDHSTNADRTAVGSQIGMTGFGSCYRSAGDLSHSGNQHATCQYIASAEL